MLHQHSKINKTRLIDSNFSNQCIHKLQKVRFKKTCYQDATLLIEWQEYLDYTAVKITAKNRDGQEIFTNPMLLITNKSVTTSEQALSIYQIYLKRSRIETVFKFLKEGLGWEEIQVRNFLGIQRLLSFCFFIAAYLYKIGDQEVHDDYVILLARLGGGKGVAVGRVFGSCGDGSGGDNRCVVAVGHGNCERLVHVYGAVINT